MSIFAQAFTVVNCRGMGHKIDFYYFGRHIMTCCEMVSLYCRFHCPCVLFLLVSLCLD